MGVVPAAQDTFAAFEGDAEDREVASDLTEAETTVKLERDRVPGVGEVPHLLDASLPKAVEPSLGQLTTNTAPPNRSINQHARQVPTVGCAEATLL